MDASGGLIKARGKPREMIGHGKGAKIYFGERDGGGLAFLSVPHVDPIGGQSQLEQGTGEAGIGFDDGEGGAGRYVGAGGKAAGEGHGRAGGVEEGGGEVEFAGAQGEDGVVGLGSHLQRPPVGACLEDLFQGVLDRSFWGVNGEGGGASFTIVLNVDKFVMKAGIVDGAFQGRENHTFCVCGTVAPLRELAGALLDVLDELLRLNDFVNETPVFGALAANAVRIGAENVGMVAADVTFVSDAREAAGAGQNA